MDYISNGRAAHVGEIGEAKFRGYADAHGIPYLWVDQRPETTPAWLRRYSADGKAKRPDAVIGTGDDLLLIEVKYKQPTHDGEHFTLDRKDAERLAETERLLGKEIVLAYRDKTERDGEWYAIKLGEALALGTVKHGERGPY